MPTLLSPRDEERILHLARSQPETAGELTALLEQLRERVVEVALGDEQVRGRLAGVRYRVLTTDYREDKAPDGEEVPRLAEVGIYDYQGDVLVVAAVDLRRGEVTEVFERQGTAPPISPEELEEAREIAARTPGIAAALGHARSQVVAFVTPSYAFEARPGAEGHRGCAIYAKGPEGEVSAVVDLTAQKVVPDDELPEILRSDRGTGAGSSANAQEER
jgi:hypothetical protein